MSDSSAARDEDLAALVPMLARNFEAEELPQAAAVDRATLLHWLADRIGVLLERNPGLLMHLLYRVDVAEPKVKAALQSAPPGQLAGVLADLVLARLQEKLTYRRQYASEPEEAAREQPPER